MDNIYIEYLFNISPKEPATEILIAELGNVGFESFVENEDGLLAYIQKKDWQTTILEPIFCLNSKEFRISYTYQEIEQTNWNAAWEENFSPIIVDDLVSIRAPFHKDFDVAYDIVIEPKMSFGTGHHETTYMMIQQLLQLDLKHKKTLDMGCGTGILAIFAAMKGASPIDAIDIDNWCYQNSLENVSRNGCSSIAVYEGDATLLKDKSYDVIIANINRNILLKDMDIYAKSLTKNGVLLLSGFYEKDIPVLLECTEKLGLHYVSKLLKNNWVSLKFTKD